MSSEVNLVNLCLNCITRNFDIFNSAYNTSHDSQQLYRNLNFLQRKYSEYLIEHVSDKKGCLSGNYIEFLINEHLKELDCGRLFKAPWSSVFKKMDEMGHVLEKVSFETMYYLPIESTYKHFDFINETVRKLKNVRELEIKFFANDETLKSISTYCRKVTSLDLDWSEKITPEGLKQFSLESGYSNFAGSLPLKTFFLQSDRIEVEGLFPILENFPTLEHLHKWKFPSSFIEKYVNDSEKKIYNLRILDLTTLPCCLFKEELSVLLELCPKLEKLALYYISGKDELMMLSKLTLMKDLTINDTFTDSELRNVRTDLNDLLSSIGAGLRHLSVSGFVLSVEVLIKECTNLETLSLCKPHFLFAKKETSNIYMLYNLKKLSVIRLDFSTSDSKESFKRILESCPRLEDLSLFGCNLSDSNLARIITSFCENNSSLQMFRVDNCRVEWDLLEKVLRSCSALQTLFINCCRGIDENDFLALKDTATSLKKITDIKYRI